MNQEKIIQAIAAYLEKETYFSETLIKDQKTRQFMRINVMQSHSDFCQEIAAELADAIAPHLEAESGWEDAPEWANYKTKDPDGSVFFWELEPQKKEDFWSQNANGGRFIVIGVDSWEELHQRPG